MPEKKESPNFLLHGFILVSLVIHVFIFLHIAGIYENGAISYIELTMQQISKPDIRAIPKPRPRTKELKVQDTRIVKANRMVVPRIKIDEVRTRKPEYKHDRIDIPELPDNLNVAGLSAAYLNEELTDIGTHEEQIEFTSAREYFEMLNMRIHSFKEYPESAKSNHLEGNVKVEFVLAADGTLAGIKIIKSSRHKNLDEAAIQAIKRASPFPRPPSFLFKPPVTMRIDILFELA